MNHNILSDEFSVKGYTFDKFREYAELMDKNSEIELIDLKESRILHTVKERKDGSVAMLPVDTDKTGGMKLVEIRPGVFQYQSAVSLNFPGRLFSGELSVLKDEMLSNIEDGTVFEIQSDIDKPKFYFTSCITRKTAAQNLPLKQRLTPSFAKDVALAIEINEASPSEPGKKSSRSNPDGTVYAVTRKCVSSPDIKKIFGYFSKRSDRISFMDIYNEVFSLERRFGKAECYGFTMNQKQTVLTVTYKNLSKEFSYSDDNGETTFIPCIVFTTSDTGYVSTSVRAGYIISDEYTDMEVVIYIGGCVINHDMAIAEMLISDKLIPLFRESEKRFAFSNSASVDGHTFSDIVRSTFQSIGVERLKKFEHIFNDIVYRENMAKIMTMRELFHIADTEKYSAAFNTDIRQSLIPKLLFGIENGGKLITASNY